MKRFLFFTLTLMLCLTLFSCKSSKGYSDGIPCSELLDTAEEQIPIDLGYESFDGDHIKLYFENTELDDDRSLRYSVASENINEMGIFHAPDEGSAKELKEITQRYLDGLLEEKGTFIGSYAPKELEKLENAEVRIFGNYVAYAILSADDRKLFFDTIENALKG